MIQIARTVCAGFLLITLGLLLPNCSSSDATPSESQRVTSLLKTGTWKIQSVSVDGTNQNALFTNFTLTFSDTGFTSANGDPVWPSSGTWTFVNDEATSFTRNDEVVVSIQDISSTLMTLSLTWSKTTFGGGRINSLQGQHVFVLVK